VDRRARDLPQWLPVGLSLLTTSGRMPMTPDTPLTDPLIWLTWVAAQTSTIRLGTGILILPSATRWSWPRRWPPSTR
jgi:alkanesulfonate monooxygenase SsuD/methylene tetrahydromethanopterin reductase-like flavin-dependent oxidoreductase (luciferase family)